MTDAGVYYFEDGLPGFEQEHEFRLEAPPHLAPLLLLASAVTPGLRFVCVPAQILLADYQWEPPGGCALAILTFPETGAPTANLLAPLVLDPRTRRGAQVIQADSGYSCQHPLPRPVEAQPC